TSHSVAQQLIPIPPLSYNEITVQGFTSQSSLYRKDKRLQYFFINNRAVQSTMLNSAMSRAYDQVIHHGLYPVCVLFITLDPTLIDVNVHPTKATIRFEDEKS